MSLKLESDVYACSFKGSYGDIVGHIRIDYNTVDGVYGYMFVSDTYHGVSQVKHGYPFDTGQEAMTHANENMLFVIYAEDVELVDEEE